jgi:dUTP pyrophosphatase
MSAGVDLLACVDEQIQINPGSLAVLVPTGLAVHIGLPHVAALIVPRSGMGHKRGLILGNTIGVIDGDFTGQLMISAWNRNALDSSPILIQPGERIAQLLFVPIIRPDFEIVSEFSLSSVRGDGGFGSTGYNGPNGV